jgi:hypothetical protein
MASAQASQEAVAGKTLTARRMMSRNAEGFRIDEKIPPAEMREVKRLITQDVVEQKSRCPSRGQHERANIDATEESDHHPSAGVKRNRRSLADE